MPSVTTSITIQRSVEEVFEIVTDVENTGKWFPGNVEEQWTSAPPHGIGSTRHAVVTVYGWRTENDAVVTEYDPPRRAVMAGTSPNAPFVVTLTFAPDAIGTRVEVHSQITLRGARRAVGPVAVALYGRAWDRGLANLKWLMESGAL